MKVTGSQGLSMEEFIDDFFKYLLEKGGETLDPIPLRERGRDFSPRQTNNKGPRIPRTKCGRIPRRFFFSNRKRNILMHSIRRLGIYLSSRGGCLTKSQKVTGCHKGEMDSLIRFENSLKLHSGVSL